MAANPCVEARREWDERYADLVLGKRNWQIAAGALLLLSLILASVIVWLISRSRSDSFTHNPLKLAEKQTISTQIDSILQLSPASYQVRWTEQPRDLNGVAIASPTHLEAVLQTQISPPNSDDAIVINPLGFYVTQISWTEQQE